MERARTEWLRSMGVEQDSLIENHGVIFAVRAIEVDYLKPARFNQLLGVSVNVIQRGKVSITFDQQVRRLENSAISDAYQQYIQAHIQEYNKQHYQQPNQQRNQQHNQQQQSNQQGEAGIGQVEGELLCHGRIKVASLDSCTLAPKAFPASVYKEIFL